MAANLKIGIIADDNGAQQKFEGLSTSVDLTAKSVTQLANQFAKLNAVKVNILNTSKDTKELNEVTSAMTTTYKQLMNAIERQKLSWGVAKDSVASLKKELAELDKVQTLLVSKGVGSSMSGELEDLTVLINKYEEYKRELKEIIKLKEKEEVEAAKGLTPSSVLSSVSGTAQYQKNGLLGDDVAQMKQTYEAYSEALTKIINTLGAGSPEAKAMASAMGELGDKMKSLQTQTTATTKRIGNLIKNFVSAQMIVWAIRKAFTAVTNTLKESAEAAAEAEETYNLFVTTFEDVASTAEKTATRLASSLGMANSTAQRALGTFGDLAAGYGATDKEALEFGETATQVAMDIISYKNISGDTATTLQSIASGLAGNVENFRKLGYVMTQAEVKTKLQKKGLDKLTGASLQYAQIQARLEILQEKSVKAQGDMVKTLDSTTNVTRRLSEAWLEYEENLGESVNNFFTPLKKWWLEILDLANKANQAKENYLKYGSGRGVYDVENNESDKNALINKIKLQYGQSGAYANSYALFSKQYDTYSKQLVKIMQTFSTSPETVMSLFRQYANWGGNEKARGNKVEEILANLEEDLAEAYGKWVKEEESRVKAEEVKAKKLTEISSAISFFDNLSSIAGVYVNDSALTARQGAVKNDTDGYIPSTLSQDYQAAINSLIKSLSSASGESFVSALDIALGREDTESMLEAKLESVESVYEALWNEFYSSGEELTAWQQNALNQTLELAKSINSEIEGLNKEVEKYSPSWGDGDYRTLSGISDSLSAYLSAFEDMAELTGANTYDISHKVEDYLSSISDALNGQLTEADFNTFYRDAQGYFNTVTSAYSAGVDSSKLSSDPYSYLSAIQMATGENTLLDALEAQLDAYTEYYEAAGAYFKADGTLTEEEQTILDSLLGKISNIYGKIEEESAEDEKREEINVSSLLGEWGTNPLQWLIDLTAQLDAVTKAGSLLSDSVLPVLNACLEPLLPMLNMVGSLIQNMVLPALEILFPAIKAIAKMIVVVAGSINVGVGLIVDSVKKMIGSLVYTVTSALNTAFGWAGVNINNGWAREWMGINILGNTQSRINEMTGYLAEIDAMTMEIKKNTDEDEMDLSVLNNLFDSGIISRDEMDALRASYLGQADPGKQTQLIASQAGDYASYLRAGGTTSVNYGDISIEINSDSGDPEKIAKALVRVLEEQQRNGKKSFAVAIA